MVPRETGRREFLVGAAGVGAAGSAEEDPDAQNPETPAVGIPDLHADHRVSWEFTADGEKAVVYPFASTDGAVFAFVRQNRPDAEKQNTVQAIDVATGETRWKRPTSNVPVLEVASNGRIYDRGEKGLRAFDVADGSLKWEHRLDDGYLREFRVTDGVAVVATTEELSALDAASGTERWRVPVESDPENMSDGEIGDHVRGVTVAGETVYFGSTEGFTALGLADGEERWHVPIHENAAWSSAVRDGLLVGWSNEAVYGIETTDGTRRFRTSVSGLRAQDMGGTVGERTAYVWGERLTAVDLQTGGKRWTYADEGDETGSSDGRGFSPIVSDGRVYTATSDDSVVSLDTNSGRKQWEFENKTPFGHWGEVAGDYVYLAGEQQIHAFDAETGRKEWSLEVGDEETTTWVSSSGDSVFVGTRGGRLYAIDPPSRLVAAPVETATAFATSSPGLGLLGLVGAGLLGVGYRRAKRRTSATDLGDDPAVELGRLELLGGGPVTETHLKRVQTPDGTRLVAETRLTESVGSETRRAFAEAVEKWADLDADGVLPVRESGPDSNADADPRPWFETPLLAGGSLADSWPLDYRERVEIASAVARTLHAAHAEEVVHGRLAPRHVFRGAPGDENNITVATPTVRVGGWFLADAFADIRDESDPYAPPESRNGGDESVAGDVYRVGALARHLLAGQLPDTSGNSANSDATSGGRSLQSELDAVLDRALAADPADRYDSALTFDDEFRWAALDR